MALIQELRKKRYGGQDKKKKTSGTVTILAGWLNYSYKEAKYFAIKSSRFHPQSGPRKVHLPADADYMTTLEHLKGQFFTGGKSFLGRSIKYDFYLGTFTGSHLEPSTFNIQSFREANRIYLLTKEKLFVVESDSSSSDFDSLPDIQFNSQRSLKTSSQQDLQMFSLMQNSGLTSTCTQEAIEPTANSINSQITPMNTSASCSTVSILPSVAGPSGQCQVDGTTVFRDACTPTVTLRLSRNCMVCYDRELNAFFFPCGHTACTVCAVFLQENSQKCPQCKKCITEVKPIFNE